MLLNHFIQKIMKKILGLLALYSLVVLNCCRSNELISNEEYLSNVNRIFDERKELASNRYEILFSVFNDGLSKDQTDAMKFLYAFMPLNDLADYDGEFFLANVNKALQSRNETEWGKQIPENIFLHYVLPCRVNNENLDSFRIVYYNEIKDRIKGLSMKEAALEVNHWCHEKVNYQPSDIRTSSPMSTILSARGRCGEESTFTVAALRTAGIPARQVYTPRWAHTDDNHAWVEIWDAGNWYYMGACEPEPVLDLGWFTEPARRAMLVHTKSFGAPDANENTINKFKLYSEVNNLAKYALTRPITVLVLNSNNEPSKNAAVEFKLYNYAEYYSLATVNTDSLGISRFETGLGDLLIWASDGKYFDFKKISVAATDTLVLKLTRNGSETYSFDLDLDVPILRTPLASPSPELLSANSKRFEEENLIRQRYIDSWIKNQQIDSLAITLNIDSIRLRNILRRSMGNYRAIISFISLTHDSLRNKAIDLLETVAEKDLRDTKDYIFSDHLSCRYDSYIYKGAEGYKFYLKYVLNPRVANEILTDWRSAIHEKLPEAVKTSALSDPNQIVKYLNETVHIADEENYYGTPITPKGVLDLKVSDSDSRAICFVAICRALGIGSRLEEGSNLPQYFINGSWYDVYFADQKKPELMKAFISLKSSDSNPEPEYYTHFTLARLVNGRYITLEYRFNQKISEFDSELALLPGSYMLVTGNRLNTDKILSSISIFNLEENEHKKVEVKIRKDLSERKISGTIDLVKIIALFDQQPGLKPAINSKGTVILWVEPDKEPTKHVFNDLPLLKSELDKWGGDFIFLSDSKESMSAINSETMKGLPENSFFGVDGKFGLLSEIKLANYAILSYPYILLADKDGNVTYSSSGYRIGIGEQIIKNVK